MIVPLPMSEKEYLSDFISETGKRSFSQLLKQATVVLDLPETDNHENSYRQLGFYLIDHCDYLLTIWNGDFNHEEGGTGEVITYAKKKRKPIHWIYCENEKPGAKNPLHGKKKSGEIQNL